MTTAIKTRSRNRRKAIALADAELALADQPTLPFDMAAEIAALMVKPGLNVWDISLLKNAATENANAKAAMGRKDWFAGWEFYLDAVGDALAGGDLQAILRKLARQVSA